MTEPPMGIEESIVIPGAKTRMPRLGFGVYQIRSDDCQVASLAALDAGYRHIDSAQLYRNEAAVGRAVAKSSIARDNLFLTTKCKRSSATLSETYEKALGSVEKLGGPGGYVDLFLIHVPGPDPAFRKQLWQALEMLHANGKSKAIGVSNFHIHHLEEMKEYAQVWPPHVNQIELHPWCQQRDLVKYCQDNSIIIQAYSPLVRGTRSTDPVLSAIAAKHGKSAAQVLIRYSLQKEWVPLPKSKTVARIRENADVFDFTLHDDDMRTLDDLDQGAAGAQFPANAS